MASVKEMVNTTLENPVYTIDRNDLWNKVMNVSNVKRVDDALQYKERCVSFRDNIGVDTEKKPIDLFIKPSTSSSNYT